MFPTFKTGQEMDIFVFDPLCNSINNTNGVKYLWTKKKKTNKQTNILLPRKKSNKNL